jgi:hypothetical protein
MALELLAGQEASAVAVFLRQEVPDEGALEVARLVKGALEDLERRAGAAAAAQEARAQQVLVRHAAARCPFLCLLVLGKLCCVKENLPDSSSRLQLPSYMSCRLW